MHICLTMSLNTISSLSRPQRSLGSGLTTLNTNPSGANSSFIAKMASLEVLVMKSMTWGQDNCILYFEAGHEGRDDQTTLLLYG